MIDYTIIHKTAKILPLCTVYELEILIRICIYKHCVTKIILLQMKMEVLK